MTRPKGSKNNKPVIFDAPVTTLNESFIENEEDDYIIIERQSTIDLCKAIYNHLGIGYQCQGGVSITSYADGRGGQTFVYCQAMVRHE